jgi:hypothetical protein
MAGIAVMKMTFLHLSQEDCRDDENGEKEVRAWPTGVQRAI